MVPIVAILVVVGGLIAFVNIQARQDAGKVLFTTDQPTQGSGSICHPKNQVTSVKAGTPVYSVYFFSTRPGDSPVSMSITKDGVQFLPATAVPVSQTKGLDCVGDTTDWSQLLKPGTYKITMTYEGKTISEGTLTITP